MNRDDVEIVLNSGDQFNLRLNMVIRVHDKTFFTRGSLKRLIKSFLALTAEFYKLGILKPYDEYLN